MERYKSSVLKNRQVFITTSIDTPKTQYRQYWVFVPSLTSI